MLQNPLNTDTRKYKARPSNSTRRNPPLRKIEVE